VLSSVKKSGKSTLLILEENIDYLILGGGNLKNEKFENNNFDNVKPSYENLNFIKGEIFQKISIDSLCQIMIKYNQTLHISEIFDIYYNEELWQWRLNRNLLWNIAIDIIEEKIISELNLGIGSKIYVVDADFYAINPIAMSSHINFSPDETLINLIYQILVRADQPLNYVDIAEEVYESGFHIFNGINLCHLVHVQMAAEISRHGIDSKIFTWGEGTFFHRGYIADFLDADINKEWSEWIDIKFDSEESYGKFRKALTKKSCVYKIRLVTENKECVNIRHPTTIDEFGIVYIGKSDNLRRRYGNNGYASYKSHENGVSSLRVAHRKFKCNKSFKENFSNCTLQISYKLMEMDKTEDFEKKLLACYSHKHINCPLFNSIASYEFEHEYEELTMKELEIS